MSKKIKELRKILDCGCSYYYGNGKIWDNKAQEYVDCNCSTRIDELQNFIDRELIIALAKLHRYEGEDKPKRDYDNAKDEAIDELIEELEHKK